MPGQVPNLGLETALKWVQQTRADRDAFVERCASELTLVDVRDLVAGGGSREGAGVDLQTLRLLPILEALPAAGGKVASRRSMDAAGLPHDTVCGDVPPAAWEMLIGRLSETETSEPRTSEGQT